MRERGYKQYEKGRRLKSVKRKRVQRRRHRRKNLQRGDRPKVKPVHR